MSAREGHITQGEHYRAACSDKDIIEFKQCKGDAVGETPIRVQTLRDSWRAAHLPRISENEYQHQVRRDLKRREVFKGLFFSALASGLTPQQAFAKLRGGIAVPGAPPPLNSLPLAPPVLATGYKTQVLSPNGGSAHLSGGDWLVIPPAVPITGLSTTVNSYVQNLNGESTGRNMIMLGGEIAPIQVTDFNTMQLLSGGGYAVWAKLGFTGATGGTFTITTQQTGWFVGYVFPVTAPIAWNATASQVKDAINLAIRTKFSDFSSPDPCFTVVDLSGTNAPGGPWQIVPNYNPGLGKPSINITGLTGAPVKTTFSIATQYLATLDGCTVQNFLGTVFIAGLLSGLNSTVGNDGMDWAGKSATFIQVMQNCQCWARASGFNEPDWIHPDGCQTFDGTAKGYRYNVDLIGPGSGFIDQPTTSGTPDALYNYWLHNVQARLTRVTSTSGPYIPAQVNRGNAAYKTATIFNDFTFDSSGCFANVVAVDNLNSFITNLANSIYAGGSTFPPGWTLGNSAGPITPNTINGWFADPALNQCGIGYIDPGYQVPAGTPYPSTTQIH